MTFNTAFKAVRSYELRICPRHKRADYVHHRNRCHARDRAVGTEAYVYQGQSDYMSLIAVGLFRHSIQPNKLTADLGFIAKNGATTIASGNRTKSVGGWADCSNSSGVGIEAGMYQFSAYWPVSLECLAVPRDSNRAAIRKKLLFVLLRRSLPGVAAMEHLGCIPELPRRNPRLSIGRFSEVPALPPGAPNSRSCQHYAVLSLHAGGPGRRGRLLREMWRTLPFQQYLMGDLCYGGATTNCSPDQVYPLD